MTLTQLNRGVRQPLHTLLCGHSCRAMNDNARDAQSRGAASVQLMQLLSKWADSCLPVLLRTMTRALHRAQRAASEAAEPAAAGGSSSGSNSPRRGGSSSRGSIRRVLPRLLATLSECVRLLGLVGVATTVNCTGLWHGRDCR